MQTTLLFIENIGMGSLILIVVIVLLLFGGKKIPELMRGVGKGIGEFKKGINDDGDIDSDSEASTKKAETKSKKKESKS